jgi:hypothetical protein
MVFPSSMRVKEQIKEMWANYADVYAEKSYEQKNLGAGLHHGVKKLMQLKTMEYMLFTRKETVMVRDMSMRLSMGKFVEIRLGINGVDGINSRFIR